jgi:hypothetical protein
MAVILAAGILAGDTHPWRMAAATHRRRMATARLGTAGTRTSVSPFNFVTLTAFLAWFGGTGFLITRFSSIWFALGLLIALAAGLFGAGIVFLFLSAGADLARGEHGFGRLRNGGRAGTNLDAHPRKRHRRNHLLAGRNAAHLRRAQRKRRRAIEKGAEIVVTRYDKGIAYVRLWEEMSEDEAAQSR